MSARRRRSPRARIAPIRRDQRESAFTSILAGLLQRVPGARAAALVDRDGETVDYAGEMDTYAVRLAAAHWRLVLDELGRQDSFRSVRWVVLRAHRTSFLVHDLPEEYALVLVLARAAGFSGWGRAVAACARALGDEAGWTWVGLPWFPAQVTADGRGRPLSVRVLGGRVCAIQILGSMRGGLGRSERGWRVRFDTGVEATLVREPGGVWYTDEPIENAPLDAAAGTRKKSR
jgi:hypothetical protein